MRQMMARLAEGAGWTQESFGDLLDALHDLCEPIRRQAAADEAEYGPTFVQPDIELRDLTEAEWFLEQPDHEKVRLIAIVLKLEAEKHEVH